MLESCIITRNNVLVLYIQYNAPKLESVNCTKLLPPQFLVDLESYRECSLLLSPNATNLTEEFFNGSTQFNVVRDGIILQVNTGHGWGRG